MVFYSTLMDEDAFCDATYCSLVYSCGRLGKTGCLYLSGLYPDHEASQPRRLDSEMAFRLLPVSSNITEGLRVWWAGGELYHARASNGSQRWKGGGGRKCILYSVLRTSVHFHFQHRNSRTFAIESLAHDSGSTVVCAECGYPKGSPNTNS
jgi:hypothetical protein